MSSSAASRRCSIQVRLIAFCGCTSCLLPVGGEMGDSRQPVGFCAEIKEK